MKLSRFWRALIGAARMTLRGEAVPPPGSIAAVAKRYPQTAAWLAETVVLVERAWSSAEGSRSECGQSARGQARDVTGDPLEWGALSR
jgi:hypothetical protein